MPPLIAKLSSQTNNKNIKQLEFKALQRPKDFNFITAFLTHAHKAITKSMVLFSLIFGVI